MIFDSEETKAWNAYEKKTRGMGIRMSKAQFLRMHYPKKKVSDDSGERYTMAKNRTEAIGNMARHGNAITAKELAKFNKAK